MDPLGGSFFVEAQTDRIEKQAYDYFQRIADLGGVIPAIEKGFFQNEISEAAYRYQREIPPIFRAYATLGEMIGVMKEAFGVYAEPTWI